MTGEITLRGRVLPIGGLREKVIAAHRAGLKTILIPKKNEKDLVDVPKRVQREMQFVFVDRMDQVLPVALMKRRDSRNLGGRVDANGTHARVHRPISGNIARSKST